jgi:flagellar hook-associated protein 2
MATSVDGLISGLSTSSTITQLMNVEKLSQTRLTAKKSTNDDLVSTYQALNSKMLALKDAGAGLRAATGWQVTKASSSDLTLATATATSTAQPGSLTFRIERLATSHTMVSSGTVSSTDALVATPNSHLLVSAASALGFSKLVGSNDLSVGAHTIEVTQSSAGAKQTGTAALGTTITLLPHTIVEVATDGSTSTTQSIELAGGTYTRTELADQITAASGGTLKASFSNDGKLELTSAREGSAAHLAITGGTDLNVLGLSVSGSASAGSDGIVKVDSQSTTLTDINPGATTVLAATGAGSITATFAAGLRVGTTNTANVDLGDGKLSTVTTAINSAAAGFSASSVQVSAGKYRVQFGASGSGEAGKITTDTTFLDASLGSMQTLSEPVDAKLTVGTGPAAYTVTSSSNKAEVLPGVTVALVKAAPTTDVTVSVNSDADGIATKVLGLIDAVNGAFGYINSQSRYDTTTKKGGPLLGDSTTRSLERQLYGAFGSIGNSMASMGITVAKDSGLQFDKAKFIAAYQANPAAVQAAFTDATTGIAARVENVGKAATDSTTGILTTTINGRQALSKNLTEQIANWDTRLALRETALRRQFTNLEVALGKIKADSDRLAGEILKLG